MAVGCGEKRASDFITFSGAALRALTRRSSEGRPVMASPSATQSEPKARSSDGTSHSGISACVAGGAADRSAVAPAISSGVSGSGA
jgi:hypothetical protein